MRGGWRWFGGGPMGDAAARCVDEVFLCSFFVLFCIVGFVYCGGYLLDGFGF